MTSFLSFPNDSVYCAAHVHFHVCVCVYMLHVCISCGRTGGLKTCLLHLEVTASIGATSKFDKEIIAHHSLLWVKLCSPQIHVKIPQNVALLRDEVFRVAPIQYNWCPYGRGNVETTFTQGQWQARMKPEMGCYFYKPQSTNNRQETTRS